MLREVRKARHVTLEQLSEAVAISVSQLSRFESGHRKPRLEEAERIARVLKIDLSELSKGARPSRATQPSKKSEIKSAAVIGVVQAGVWTEFENFEDDSVGHDFVPAISGNWSHLPQVAYKVRGESMDTARICDGDYVVAVPYFDARAEITNGDIVVVERTRNSATERTVKIIDVSGSKIILRPSSSDSRFKPFHLVKNTGLHDGEGSEVRIVGLVIGRWTDF